MEINVTFKRSLSKEETVGSVCTKKIQVFLSMTVHLRQDKSQQFQSPFRANFSFFDPTSGTNAVT